MFYKLNKMGRHLIGSVNGSNKPKDINKQTLTLREEGATTCVPVREACGAGPGKREGMK